MATVYRPKRNVWTSIRCESTDGLPPLPKEGDTWWDPCVGVARQFNGTTWEYFHFSEDYSSQSATGISGYIAGGVAGTSTTTDKIIFISESIASISSNLSAAHVGAAGFNSLAAGYASGGYPPYIATIAKLTFSSEAISAVVSSAPFVHGMAGACNSSLAGYVTGFMSTQVGKLFFSTDSTALLASNLSFPVAENPGFESTNNGYIIECETSGHYNFRIDFSTDALSLVGSPVIHPADNTAGGFAGPLAGYIAGGQDFLSNTYSTVEKMLFSSEAFAIITSTMSVARYYVGGNNSRVTGYMMGGGYATVDRLNFTTDAVAQLASSMSVARNYPPTGMDNLN